MGREMNHPQPPPKCPFFFREDDGDWYFEIYKGEVSMHLLSFGDVETERWLRKIIASAAMVYCNRRVRLLKKKWPERPKIMEAEKEIVFICPERASTASRRYVKYNRWFYKMHDFWADAFREWEEWGGFEDG